MNSRGYTALALELAARSCGTNTAELADRGMDQNTSSGVLANLVASGRLWRIEGLKDPDNWPLHQYFVSADDAAAWAGTPLGKRPNLRLRRSSASSTSGNFRRPREKPPAPVAVQRPTWAKSEMPGSAPPPAVAPQCAAPDENRGAVDGRYRCTAEEAQRLRVSGGFSALGIGRYATEASSCAARAVRA